MQFQVPQFIETEDKIVGPLSLRQFLFIGAGFGICAALYFILQTWLWVILAIIVMGIAVSISFVKIQGRPLIKVVFSAFNFYWSPQTYVWQPEHAVLPQREKEISPKTNKGPSVVGILARIKVAEGSALHKSWQGVQTGEKISDKEFAESKMYGRYQIFQKMEGDRAAARRVDYR
jgi:hypothetical protein